MSDTMRDSERYSALSRICLPAKRFGLGGSPQRDTVRDSVSDTPPDISALSEKWGGNQGDLGGELERCGGAARAKWGGSAGDGSKDLRVELRLALR